MKTLTKLDLAQTILTAMPVLTIDSAKLAAERLCSELKEAIFARETIYIPKVCRINVTVKKERTVRNPKTGEQYMLPPIHSVTSGNSRNRIQSDKLTKSKLILNLKSAGYTLNDATKLVEIFYGFIAKVLTGHYRIEIRGLGVFSPRIFRARVVRNPKTGEALTCLNSIKVSFKCSVSLRKAMDKVYLC